MNNSKVALALLATTALIAPSTAYAQTYEPMERQAPDDNGVDVISGKVTIPVKSITVGNGDSNLTYAKGWAAGQPWDTFDSASSTLALGSRRWSQCSATSTGSPAAARAIRTPTPTAAR